MERPGETEEVYRQALSYARSWLSDVGPESRRRVHLTALSIISRHVRRLVLGSEDTARVLRDISLEIEHLISAPEESLTF